MEVLSLAKSHKYVALFIPQAKREAFEAGQQRDRLDCAEEGIAFMASLKVIIRNARTQVMNMVEPDIASKPLQGSRQLVEGTALQRRRRMVPMRGACPIGAGELMLHVK